MNKFNLTLRRLHLYTGMLLIPWVLIYGLSTFILNHRPMILERFPQKGPQWQKLFDKSFTADLRQDEKELRAVAKQILEAQGWHGAYSVNRQGEKLNINLQNFRAPKRLTYFGKEQRLLAEQKTFAWYEIFTRLHFRTGYNLGGFKENLWALIVDLFCLSMIVWIVTGLYLWWKISDVRLWGWIAIAGGFASFIMLLLRL